MVSDFALPYGTHLHWHEHTVHQLAWAATGVLSVSAAGGTWVLPATRALWIPPGVPHSVDGGPALMRAVYLTECPHEWRSPTVVDVGSLLRELINHLAVASLTADARRRAESVLLDLLEPVSVTTVRVPLPADPRARRVADAVTSDPADDRGLDAWGREAGASGRTLARIFAAETGMSFGRWRGQARLRAALLLLASGTPVGAVAHRVGYATPSAFVAAFRRALGVSPSAYFRPPPPERRRADRSASLS